MLRSRILRMIGYARRVVAAVVGVFKTEGGDNLLLEDGSRILSEDE